MQIPGKNVSQKDFIKQFEQLREWIRSSVSSFKDDNPGDKILRMQLAEKDKIFFARTYFPHYCEDDFAEIHKKMFKLCDIENKFAVIAGGRELAKSTVISFFDEMHKSLFKKNRFTVFICDTQDTAASEFLLPLKAEFEENPRILNDFGDLRSSLWGMDDFVIKSGKRFLALGPKMGAKGKRYKASRPDRIIFEDMENQNSPKKKTILKQRIKFITRDVLKSVNSKKWQGFFIGNYFSKKTVLHILLNADEFAHFERHIFPAMIEKNGKLKSVWESRLATKMLLQERADDPAAFKTERMQKPDDEEAIFKEEWIQYFELDDYISSLPVVTYHDPSALKGEEHCYKAIITLAVDKANATYYCLDAWIKKTSKWKASFKHFEISKKYRSAVDAVESNGFQSTLKEDYELIEQKEGRRINLKLISNRIPKDTRIGTLSSPIERGYIKFRRNHSDQALLIEQLVDFPDGDFVDGPDALAGCVETADIHILRKRKKISANIL